MYTSTSSQSNQRSDQSQHGGGGGQHGLSQSSLNQLASFLPSTPLSSVLPNTNSNTSNTSNGYNFHVKQLSPSARKAARSKALEEADAVLSTNEYTKEKYLDHFNLLSVVTSPRLLEDVPSVHGTSIAHVDGSVVVVSGGGGVNSGVSSSTVDGNVSATATTTTNSSSSSTLHWSESLSKEIESLNTTLYSYSKNYLGNYGSSETTFLDFQTELAHDDIPTTQLPLEDLPKELLDLDLTTVEAYLRKCGGLAHRLKLRHYGDEDDDENHDAHAHAHAPPLEQDDGTDSVPEIFFSQYFDLTNPQTFSSLLVLGDDESSDDDDDEDADGIEAAISSIIRIQKPEKLTQHLDTIELALLNQVRSKSSSFFRETNRFSYLKSLVAESVQEVQSLRAHLDQIRERSITDVELIPIMDRRRGDVQRLGEVLDEIVEVVQVKGSVGGLIQSGDYLGAVDAIHVARRLLNGESRDDGGDGVDRGGRHVLRKISALNKIHDQLAQYENLVVSCASFIIYRSSMIAIPSLHWCIHTHRLFRLWIYPMIWWNHSYHGTAEPTGNYSAITVS